MKILNLYAGIGGNRKLWGEEHEITAIEIDKDIGSIYKKNFPNDKVIISDAHSFLLEHYDEYNFIWSSPPCPSHSKIRKLSTLPFKDGTSAQNNPIYPDMRLYEEIVFLDGYAQCKWVVENVVSFYDPLIRPYQIGRHYFWANFPIMPIQTKPGEIRTHFPELEKRKMFDLENCDLDYKLKEKVLRNCVEPEVGAYILKMAFKGKQEVLA